jgi:hypothetical protein
MQLAITVIGPTGVLDIHPESASTKALLAFTRRLSAQLGYMPHAIDGTPQVEAAQTASTDASVKRRRQA